MFVVANLILGWYSSNTRKSFKVIPKKILPQVLMYICENYLDIFFIPSNQKYVLRQILSLDSLLQQFFLLLYIFIIKA